jgi:dolichol-phosphate mannosyltransferase
MAYIKGMKHAIEQLHADAIMQMDADFSHKPEDVPRLISKLDQGKDFVIGSRYIKGGKIPDNWGVIRKLNSRWGNIFARYVAGLYKVRDCTAGFRAIRSSVIKKIDMTNLRVKGYAFQMALLHKAVMANTSTEEIAVEFVDRERGETKLGFTDIVEFILNAWWIRFGSRMTLIKFGIASFLGMCISVGVFTVLINIGVGKFVASPIAVEIAIIANFLVNEFWIFARNKRESLSYLKALKFNSVSLISLAVSYLIFVILSLKLPEIMLPVHQAASMIPVININYRLSTFWKYQNKPSMETT